MTTTELRERITAALRARDHAVTVTTHAPNTRHGSVTRWRAYAEWSSGRSAGLATGDTELDALAALAVAVGLNADGTDPRAELETLRAAAMEYIDAVADIERALTGPRTGAAIDSAAMIARRNAARAALASIVGGEQ